jgi:hypothetical protein
MDNGSETYSLLNLTQKLLDAIVNKDWETYVSLTDEKLTCIEPETGNSICEGLEFHKTYFDMPKDENVIIKENILQPITKVFGDISIISYKRVRQVINKIDNSISNIISTETRVWRRCDGSWKMIHFHRT